MDDQEVSRSSEVLVVGSCCSWFLQLSRHSKEMQLLLREGTAVPLGVEPEEDYEGDALRYYANHTAQIEVQRPASNQVHSKAQVQR